MATAVASAPDLGFATASASVGKCPNRNLLAYPENHAAVEIAILCETNLRRLEAGLRPVVLNAKLSRAARGHAADMYRRGYFDHASPEGRRVLDRVQATGYRGLARCCGENIAANVPSAAMVVAGWMRSPGHRANILLRDARELGVGVTGAIPHFVQVFSLTSTGSGITGLEEMEGGRPPVPGDRAPNGSHLGKRTLRVGLSWLPSTRTGRAFVRIRVPAQALGRTAHVTAVEERRRCAASVARPGACSWQKVGKTRVRKLRLNARAMQIQVRRPAATGARTNLRLVIPAWRRGAVGYKRIDERIAIR